MTPARHHAEWLSLVETSGPFLSMPVLLRVFPQGLEQRDPAKASRLREAYEDWLERGEKQPAVHHAWIRHVLTELLEYPPEFLVEGQTIPPGTEAVMANYGETLRPEFVLKHRDAGHKPLLLIEHYAPDQDLEKPVAGKTWKASPGTRMMELLHAADVPLGLITNGEQWMIVSAPRGETTGFASWYADLWMQEPLTLRAFHSLLHLRRFLGVDEPETLAALYAESSKDQQEVTDQLGYQVRRAVEMLVQAFDRIDAESDRKLLAGVKEKDLYDSALTIMMRLVFLFSADERGLLLLGDPLYDQHYAVSTLSELLRTRAAQHGEEVLERRHDAWCRLLATFRAVHAGVEHEAMRLPPYGGTLFDPNRYPFLEGRAADTRWQTTAAKPLPINNRVVLHLLEALQVLRVRVPGGGPAEARRVSFRALDIEQIGHVYEGLLDHTAKRASEVILGLAGSKKSEPEIPLSKLEELAAKGPDALIEFLVEETKRSEKALRKALDATNGGSAQAQLTTLDHQLMVACGQDPLLAKRVRPFAALLREDDFGQLVVITTGSVYVTAGSDRRSTGTHYTPRSLTEPIVQHTLEPLVYTGPAEGKPKAEWKLKSPREILALKVCDMTMGSGAFLVQTCRYLAERLVEAWENAEQANPGKILATPEGDFSAGAPGERLIPADPAERLAIARRYVADRCLYGVDINPMAVEMAKLSLWLITLQRDRPFTFLDHALKCGDSLLGVSSVQQIENFSLRPGDRQVTFATANLFRYVDEASAKRRALEDLPSNDHTQIETKNRLHAEAEAATAKVKALADCLIAFELRGLDGDAYEDQRTEEAEKVQLLMKRDADESIRNPQSAINNLIAHAREQLRGRRLFHWAVEFPEVFGHGGFDAFVGNPPFLGGGRISTVFGDAYLRFLLDSNPHAFRSVDLCAYFFLRAYGLMSKQGNFGLIATNTVAEGDTKRAGLTFLIQNGCSIRQADRIKWPGTAAVEVVVVICNRSAWSGERLLNGTQVAEISDDLSAVTFAEAHRLPSNAMLCFEGSKIHGDGFILSLDEARHILAVFPTENKVIRRFLGGADLTSSPDFSASRFVICFEGMSREEAEMFPNCFRIVVERVKPHRDTIKSSYHAERFWRYWTERPELYDRLRKLKRTIAATRVAKFLSFAFVDADLVLSDSLVVFPTDSAGWLCLLQSNIHGVWAHQHGSSLETRFRYTYSTCFESFPLPSDVSTFIQAGEAYDQHRCKVMLAWKEGLTDIYNRFHDRGEQSADIARLRALHVEMDQAVAAAYGWSDLDLGHGFHATKQGERYTLSESARRTVLDRLLALNHQRYAAEVAAGEHDKGAKKTKKTKIKSVPASTERTMPVDFRLSASDGAHYAVSLVFALLSEAGGSLPLPRLRDAFVLATSPKLMQRLAPAEDAARVKAWSQRWNEAAKPAMFLDSLKAIGARHLTVISGAEGRIFQLLDGPKPPANEDVGYDAWLALRIAATLAPSVVLTPECVAWTKQAEELVLIDAL